MSTAAVGRAHTAVAVAGEADPHVTPPEPLTVLSLSDRFGPERSRADTAACVEQILAEYLADRKSGG